MADLPSDAGTVSFTYPFLKDVDPLRPPSSIVIPVKYLSAMTNMERQYWEIKSKLYNVVIFFKKGKFYEVYDYDAVIANREFGLKMVFDCSNRGKMRLAGVPEQSFSEWARLFVFRGYKVGRVEQMKEDPDGENITGAKIVPRELVEVLTPGTLTDLSMLADHHEVFILAVAVVDDTIDAFAVDLSRKVFLKCPCRLNAEFHSRQPGNPDGGSLSALTALLQRLHPKEVIMPLDASEASEKVLKWIETEGFCVERVAATNCAKYADATPAQMLLSSYFCSMRLERYTPLFSEATLYQFHLAPPPGTTPESSTKGSLLSWERKWDQGLVVDSNTVNNLEIVANSRDGLESFSLNHCLNNCISNGGKRLFRSWLLRPSSEYSVILGRQDAVQFLRKHQLYGNWMNEAGSSNSTPLSQKRGRVSGRGPESAYANLDFERYLSRLSDIKSESQQIAYVDPLVQYKKNLGIILSTVDAFEKMVCWAKSFHEQCASFCETLPPLLVELISGIELADKAVQEMRSLFDPNAVTESGLLIPVQGACPMYDKASIVLSSLESKLDAERIRMSTEVFGGVGISFSDLGKDLFLVEVPTVSAPAATPRGMIERTRTSKSVRYVVEAISSLVDAHKSATATKSAALLGVLREIATCFCKHSPALFNATWCFSYLDCLMNLCGMCDRHPLMCLPKIVPPEDKKVCCEGSFIMARNIIHPVMVTCTSTSPVPNSVELSTAMGRVLVLTGPNMAGKSTLMRTIAINALLAQLGGPVFAAEYSMRPLDRIFTRIGARDATTKGQSTLFVELIETAEILRFASSNSLCLIDELGRGTSTHDGLAIAYATLDSLIKRQCPPLTLFSTHYHSLALEQERRRKRDAESASSPNHGVQLGYMDFALSQQHELTSAPSTSVTFLYRFVHGVCDRSYGVEVALLAGIRPELVHLASKKSAELSRQSAFHEDAHVLAEFMNGGIDFKCHRTP